MIWVTVGATQIACGNEPELLTKFEPVHEATPWGPVNRLQFETGLVRLEAGALAYHSHEAMKSLKLTEPVWVIGYQTSIWDARNQVPQENYLCHTFLGNRPVLQPLDPEVAPPSLSGLYSDAFTQQIQLPEGFGVRLSPEDVLEWMPMFNNRGVAPADLRMRGELRLIREKDLTRPLRRLYSSLYSVKSPHLYFVAPGRHSQDTTFELPFDGRIHFIGTHIHPYGESIELRNESRNELVWKGSKKIDASGSMVGMDVYTNTQGYPVKAFDSFRLVSTYQNPTSKPIDAMAGLFLFYTRD